MITLLLLSILPSFLYAAPINNTENFNTCRFVTPLSRDPEVWKKQWINDESNPLFITMEFIQPPHIVIPLIPAYLKKLSEMRNTTVSLSRCNGTDEIYTHTGGTETLITNENLHAKKTLVTGIVLQMPNHCSGMECTFQAAKIRGDFSQAFHDVVREHEERTGKKIPSPFAFLFTTTPAPSNRIILTMSSALLIAIVIILLLVAFIIAIGVVYFTKKRTAEPSQETQNAEVPLMKVGSDTKKEEDIKCIEKCEPKGEENAEDAPCCSEAAKLDELLAVD